MCQTPCVSAGMAPPPPGDGATGPFHCGADGVHRLPPSPVILRVPALPSLRREGLLPPPAPPTVSLTGASPVWVGWAAKVSKGKGQKGSKTRDMRSGITNRRQEEDKCVQEVKLKKTGGGDGRRDAGAQTARELAGTGGLGRWGLWWGAAASLDAAVGSSRGTRGLGHSDPGTQFQVLSWLSVLPAASDPRVWSHRLPSSRLPLSAFLLGALTPPGQAVVQDEDFSATPPPRALFIIPFKETRGKHSFVYSFIHLQGQPVRFNTQEKPTLGTWGVRLTVGPNPPPPPPPPRSLLPAPRWVSCCSSNTSRLPLLHLAFKLGVLSSWNALAVDVGMTLSFNWFGLKCDLLFKVFPNRPAKHSLPYQSSRPGFESPAVSPSPSHSHAHPFTHTFVSVPGTSHPCVGTFSHEPLTFPVYSLVEQTPWKVEMEFLPRDKDRDSPLHVTSDVASLV